MGKPRRKYIWRCGQAQHHPFFKNSSLVKWRNTRKIKLPYKQKRCNATVKLRGKIYSKVSKPHQNQLVADKKVLFSSKNEQTCNENSSIIFKKR